MSKLRQAAAFLILLSASAIAEASGERTGNAVERYNTGTAQYRRQAYPKAEEALRSAVAAARPGLQGRAAYNLASSQYRQGVAATLKEPDTAEKFFEQALENYQLAIRRNPRDSDAQFNYELTQKHLELLKQQQQAKQQSAQEQQAQAGEDKKTQQAQPEKPPEEKKENTAQAAQPQSKSDNDQKEAKAAESPDKKEDKNKEAAIAQAGEKNKEVKELSEQQALWILDNMQREEYSARANRTQQSVHESNVEQDW